jgi:hypothetical protein
MDAVDDVEEVLHNRHFLEQLLFSPLPILQHTSLMRTRALYISALLTKKPAQCWLRDEDHNLNTEDKLILWYICSKQELCSQRNSRRYATTARGADIPGLFLGNGSVNTFPRK